MKTKKLLVVIVAGFLTVAISCKKDKLATQDTNTVKPTPYTIVIPKYFPTALNIPADNPMTVEGIKLGRYLYYDGRICGKKDTSMSCSTCHQQQHAFMNGLGYAYGTTGVKTSHAMLPHINLVFNSNGYLWTGEVTPNNPFYHTPGTYGGNIEDVVWIAMTDKPEFASDTTKSKEAIQAISIYPPMFKAAFGSDMVTFRNIARAISQFIRTLISSNSKFDRYMRHETTLSASELCGLNDFETETADCYHCHILPALFTTNNYYNNAKDSVFTDPFDRYSYTHNTSDIGAYTTPTLRNISYRGPYMHDGRFATLDDVINFYSSGLVWSPYVSPMMFHINTGGAQMTPSQKADLKAFLLTLSDSSFITNAAFSKPSDLP
ncbi:MAG: cytochrome c peroxidase [Bacteroidales bacterium]|jgi:cytochrome c peroxidase